VDKVRESLAQRMQKDVCVLRSLGWLDHQGNSNSASMAADIASLPPMVRQELSDFSITTCAADKVAFVQKGRRYRRCAKKRSKEENEEVRVLMMMGARYRCFQERFQRGCRYHVRNQFLQYIQALAETSTMAPMSSTMDESTTAYYTTIFPSTSAYTDNFTT